MGEYGGRPTAIAVPRRLSVKAALLVRKSGVVRQPEGDGRRPADGASFSIDALPIGTYGDADHYVTVNTSSSPAGYDVEGAEAHDMRRSDLEAGPGRVTHHIGAVARRPHRK